MKRSPLARLGPGSLRFGLVILVVVGMRHATLLMVMLVLTVVTECTKRVLGSLIVNE
jgi:hypothetical protein